jgi:hypothetical protein
MRAATTEKTQIEIRGLGTLLLAATLLSAGDAPLGSDASLGG